jgi:hypothetical protein
VRATYARKRTANARKVSFTLKITLAKESEPLSWYCLKEAAA